jgi:hypothetical protein
MSAICPVALCGQHSRQLFAAARGCGCGTWREQMNFVADCLESSGLYESVRALVGDGIADVCLVCCFVFPDAAIDDAVCAALAHRAAHGVRERLN